MTIVVALECILHTALVCTVGVPELTLVAGEALLANASKRVYEINALAVVHARLRGALVNLDLAVLASVAVLTLAFVVVCVRQVHACTVVLTNVVGVVLVVEYLTNANFFLAVFALF